MKRNIILVLCLAMGLLTISAQGKKPVAKKPTTAAAKKTNTQLICLTGLGGESIYNRFDNIYVLNLIAASLRNGMQYLKGDHLRGNEPETMIVSQIEVMEQQELIF